MLLMISKMPVYKEHLKRSGFGKIVMLLLKHPDETKENKEICRHLIERWSRAVFNKTLDYSKLAELEAEKIENIGGNGNYPSRKKSSFSSTNASASTKSTVSSRVQSSVDLFTNKKRFGEEFDQQEKTINPSDRARLPQQLSFDFLHRPQPKVDISNVSAKKMDNDSRKGRLLKRMQEIAKPGRKGKRSINVSIEGR
jgi:transcription factor SPN1